MHTITFVNTAKWIINQFREETVEFVFQWGYIQASARTSEKQSDAMQILIRCGHDVAVACERIKTRPEAVQIMTEFELSDVLGEEWMVAVVSAAARRSSENLNPEVAELLEPITHNWRKFTNCIDPIQGLLLPEAIQKESDFDEILTLEVSLPESVDGISSEAIVKFIEHADGLYKAFCELNGSSRDPLTLIYMVSGSTFRFDFTGLGEPIRALKEMFVEFWQRIRHRKAEDLSAKGIAATESLTVLHEIELSRENGDIDDEAAARLRHTIVSNMLGLFDSGALIREVPNVEQIENLKLVGEVQQKLLPAPKPPQPHDQESVEDSEAPVTVSTKSRAKASKKSTAKKGKIRKKKEGF